MLKPSFLLLENAKEVAWNHAVPAIKILTPDCHFSIERRPIVFVHGIEYANPEQVITDFFVPFEREAKLLLNGDTSAFAIYLVAWDSRLSLCASMRAKLSESVTESIWHFAIRLPVFPRHMADLERKASQVADFVLPYAKRLMTENLPSPIVVSHSLGSYLWANVVKRLWQEQDLPLSWGLWWNLQPAIPAGSFDKGEEFHEVCLAYDGISGIQSMWYSSLDFVLGTLYRVGKRRWAMGQIGPGRAKVVSRNVSFLAWEAHGLVTLRSGAGSFFRRIGNLLRRDVALLMAG